LIFFHASEHTPLEEIENVRADKYREADLFGKSKIYEPED